MAGATNRADFSNNLGNRSFGLIFSALFALIFFILFLVFDIEAVFVYPSGCI